MKLHFGRTAVFMVAAMISASIGPPAYAAPDEQTSTEPTQAVAVDAQRQARAATPRPAPANALAGAAALPGPSYGPYHIENVRSGRCLTIQGASRDTNALALQYTCENTTPFNENWRLEDLNPEDDWWHLVNQHSGKCLTVQSASTANNARTLQYPCDYAYPYNEEWYIEYVDPENNQHVHLRNGNDFNKCLTIQSASTAQNALAVIYTCDYGSPYNEEWRILPPNS